MPLSIFLTDTIDLPYLETTEVPLKNVQMKKASCFLRVTSLLA